MRPISLPFLVCLSFFVAAPACFGTVLLAERFTGFEGAGLRPGGGGGTLDSNLWQITGLSQGASLRGGTHLTGDYARGARAGRAGAGGIYAFEVEPGNVSLGAQPTGSDLTPGSFELTWFNPLATPMVGFSVEAAVWWRNEGGRATQLSLGVALAGVGTQVLAPWVTTPGPAESLPVWQRGRLALRAESLRVGPGEALRLTLALADAGGTGSRDEVAFDDLVLRGLSTPAGSPAPVPEPAGTAALLAFGLAGLASCRAARRQGATARRTATPV